MSLGELASTEKTVSNSVSMMDGKNGGKLLVGNPGNAGGTGRPSTDFRLKLGKMADENAHLLEECMNDPSVSWNVRIEAFDKAAKFGHGTQTTIKLENDQVLIRMTHAVVTKAQELNLTDDQINGLVDSIKASFIE